MYLIKIKMHSLLKIGNASYSFASGGINKDGSFEGEFRNTRDGEIIKISTLPKTAIAKSSSLNDLQELLDA